MTKLTKGLLLFSALLLPVLIFVFLKMFGSNKFDIPVFNHTEISQNVNCADIQLPHVVKGIENSLNPITSTSIVNIYHVMPKGVNAEELKRLMVVKDRLTDNEVLIHSIVVMDSATDITGLRQTYQMGGIWKFHEMRKGELNNSINCQLMITGNESIVLVDNEGKIRGYYIGSEEEEIDRLILESKILIYGSENG